jgi:hypothetical protein
VIGLLAIGLLAWYLLQPPSADALYRRIERQTSEGSTESLQQAADDIHQFLLRFPGDSRSDSLYDDLEQVEISLLGKRLDLAARGIIVQPPPSPLERYFLDAVSTAHADLDAGIAKFQAMIDLFESEQENSEAERRCILLARRRMEELTKQSQARHKEQVVAVGKRLDRADEIAKSNPAQAARIRSAVIKLYADKPWAKELVQRAGAVTEKQK